MITEILYKLKKKKKKLTIIQICTKAEYKDISHAPSLFAG